MALFFLFLSRAKAAKRLSTQRPPNTVFCIPVMVSIITQSFVHVGFLIATLRLATPYIDILDPSMHPDGPFRPNVINTMMFLLSVMMQINTFVVNYSGLPFMQSFWQHQLLSRSALIAYGILGMTLFQVHPSLNEMFELVPLPNQEIQYIVACFMVGDLMLTSVLQHLISKHLGNN